MPVITKKYNQITILYTEYKDKEWDHESEPEVELKESMFLKVCIDLDDEDSRALIYGLVLETKINPYEIKEKIVDKYQELEYTFFKKYESDGKEKIYFRDYGAQIRKEYDLAVRQAVRQNALAVRQCKKMLFYEIIKIMMVIYGITDSAEVYKEYEKKWGWN